MNLRANFLALGLYAALGLITVLVAYVAMLQYERGLEMPLPQSAQAQEGQALHLDVLPTIREEQNVRLSDELAANAELKRTLDARTRELDIQSRKLREKSEQVEKLKKQYDDAVALAIELLSADGRQRDVQQPAQPDLNEQLTNMQTEQQALVKQLDELKAELGDAYLEIAELRASAEQAVTEMMRSDLLLQAAATRVLTSTGSAAVPHLLETLRSPSAEVRRWSCEMLAALGPDARDASDALNAALNDENEGVKNAARLALRRISE